MADDIVTRLREYAELEESDLLEAADEIERLRNQIKKLTVAGNNIAESLDHDSDCGKWCTCGLDRAITEWMEARRG